MEDPTLSDIREELLAGQRLSGQGSYQRRAPSPKALPHLRKARLLLFGFVARHPDDAPAWRLLASAQEALLNYSGARQALERAIALSSPDRRDLKKLAALRESEREWHALPVSPDQLQRLGDWLNARLAESPCDHTERLTEHWLADAGIDPPAALRAFARRGGYCDCEILTNVVVG